MPEAHEAGSRNFIEEIIERDIAQKGIVVTTRFPPEPNGYLHIGHAKSICLNFGIKHKYNGRCNLRYDDTNPSKEEVEYVESIQEDVRWLGFEWDELRYASDYFEKLYECAVELIKRGKAFVCDLSAEQIREYRGTLTVPGRNSPYRDRSVQENLDLFYGMREGRYPDGARVLRAKIDMASPNMNMRDPVLYRILRATHHRTGDDWCVYPMYDYAHPISDAIEGITHSICTLEFEDHRPLYDWCLESLEWKNPSHQYEFARLNVTRTIMSKRYLKKLVDEGAVNGWDDPRMPTICGLRRRGYTGESLRVFCERIGVSKANSTVDLALLENCIREDLEGGAMRVMAVLRPLKVIIENYPEGQSETLEALNHPNGEETRELRFSRELYIERDDFMENPPKNYFRLTPGGEVRLKNAYFIKCVSVEKDASGNVTALRCTYDPDTRSGLPGAERKVKGTLHWVDAQTAITACVRLYEPLLLPETEENRNLDFSERLNPNSIEVLEGCKIEPGLAGAKPYDRFQFLRQGYFVVDSADSKPGEPVFNQIVGLKDTWAKIAVRN